MYDVAIIGTGPAGISAALNLKLHNKNLIWFGSKELSGKVEKSEVIANYPGNLMIGGADLNKQFHAQIQDMKLQITSQRVTSITAMEDMFLILGDNEVYEAKTVLLTTGAVSAAGFEGEDQYLGRGVSYCATCDGFMYKNKNIAIFCGDRQYEHEIEYLASIANQVYLFTGYKDCKIELPNVTWMGQAMKEICGEKRVNSIQIADQSKILVDGVFILRNAVAHSRLMKNLNTEGAHIIVDREMSTNKEGCFAAGDCTGRPYQIAKAVGEGNIAAHTILEYLSKRNN